MDRRKRVVLGLVIPLLLALLAYVVLLYQRVDYAVLWPGLANGTTVVVPGIAATSWGYYAGFGRITLDVSSWAMPAVYVATLNFYTYASLFNMSDVSNPVDTGYGVYYPCGHFGLVVYNNVVIPVEVGQFQGVYIYVPTDAQKVPAECYSQWPVGSNPILTFDGTPHVNMLGSVYARAYTYDPSQGLVPMWYKLYNLQDGASPWYSGAVYGSYGNTNVDGVWYLQMVAVYVTDITADVVLTASTAP